MHILVVSAASAQLCCVHQPGALVLSAHALGNSLSNRYLDDPHLLQRITMDVQEEALHLAAASDLDLSMPIILEQPATDSTDL